MSQKLHTRPAASAATPGRLDRLFRITEQGSTVRTEIVAGLSMFLAAIYAVAVIPGFLVKAGLPIAPATTAVIIAMGVATIVMGIVGKMPFIVGPGLGGAALVAVVFVGEDGIPWATALGIVAWSGVLFLVLTIFGIREILAKIIPGDLKIAISAGIGLFIALLGFRNADLVQASSSGDSLTVGALGAPAGLLALAGLILVTALTIRKVPGAFIITILALTAVGIPFGLTAMPEHWFEMPALSGEVSFHIDMLGALRPEYIPFILVLFFSEFFGMTGTFLAVARMCGKADKDGNVVDARRPFMVDSSAVIAGAAIGAPSMTAYVESMAGARSGGRTGFSAVVAGVAFLALLLVMPLAVLIPSMATAPVLMFIGLTMLSSLKNVNFADLSIGVPVALLVCCTIFWGNFGTGIAAGLVAYVLVKVACGRWREVHVGLYVLLLPLGYFFYALATS